MGGGVDSAGVHPTLGGVAKGKGGQRGGGADGLGGLGLGGGGAGQGGYEDDGGRGGAFGGGKKLLPNLPDVSGRYGNSALGPYGDGNTQG
jgi:hypothetical protein